MTIKELLPVINADAIRIYQREKLLYDGLEPPEDLLDREVTLVTPDGNTVEISVK